MALPNTVTPPSALLRAPRRPSAAAAAARKSSAPSNGRPALDAAAILPALKRVAAALWQRVVDARMAQARREIAFARSRWSDVTDAPDPRPIPTRYY